MYRGGGIGTAVLVAGDIVGNYEILDQLGRGGMGVAYRAFDRQLKRSVALKTLRQEFVGAEGTVRQLLREARAAAGLSHPGICTVHAVTEMNGLPFIVMEYVKGRTLAEILAEGPMEPMQAASLATQVVDALDAAHRGGIIHRDIKPSNIMVTDDGQVKVLDFGIAQSLMSSANPRQLDTTANVFVTANGNAGTPAYMSPEQLEGKELDERSDIFSLGVVLYEVCTGRNPFAAASQLATSVRILTLHPEPIRAVSPGFPRQLDEVVLRCLAKDPANRYASAAALLTDLVHGSSRPLWRRRDSHAMPSVAVLPFTFLGAVSHDEFVAEAFASELTSRLAQVESLLVISRTSAFRHADTAPDATHIARELGVRYVVEGTVRASGASCAVSVNLIDAETEFHAWSRTHETQLALIFDVCADVVAGICQALDLPVRRPGSGATSKAFGRPLIERYQRAVQAYHKFSAADNAVAIELLRHVVEDDPSYAPAYALLASACLARIERGWESNVPHWFGLAEDACSHALRLDYSLSEAYAARGLLAFFGRRFAEAEADAREALRFDDNNDIALNLLGRVRFVRGEFTGAAAAYRDALAINPYYVWCLNDLAWALLCTGEEEEAESTLDRVLTLSPTDEGGLSGKAALWHLRGETGQAARAIVRARESNPSYPFVLQMIAPILARAGQVEAAIMACQQMIDHERTAFFGFASMGLVRAYDGDRDAAVESARKALTLVPYHPALSLNYATLYDDAGVPDIASALVRKAVAEGIRLVEVDLWHPTLSRLAASANLFTTRSDP